MELLKLAGDNGDAALVAIDFAEKVIITGDIEDSFKIFTDVDSLDLAKGLCFLLNTVAGFMAMGDDETRIYDALEESLHDRAALTGESVEGNLRTIRLLKSSTKHSPEASFYLHLYQLEQPRAVVISLVSLLHMLVSDGRLGIPPVSLLESARQIIQNELGA